jgi:hypothetical protein
LGVDTQVGERTARLQLPHVGRFAGWLAWHYKALLLEGVRV